MTDTPSKNGTAQVVEFPGSDEEKARRFHAEVARMAAQPESYWLYLISTNHVQKFGATEEQFKQAIRAVLAKQEKKARGSGRIAPSRGSCRATAHQGERART